MENLANIAVDLVIRDLPWMHPLACTENLLCNLFGPTLSPLVRTLICISCARFTMTGNGPRADEFPVIRKRAHDIKMDAKVSPCLERNL